MLKFLKTIILLLTLSFASILLLYSSVIVKKNTVFLILPNTSTRNIARNLANEDIIDYQVSFFLLAKLYSIFYDKPILSGEYALKHGIDCLNLMQIFTGGKVIQHTFTLPEGISVQQALNKLLLLNNIQHCPDKICNIDEGSLLPETYFYTYGTLDIEIIKRMQDAMNDFINVEWHKRDKRIDSIILTPKESIILASIVEKETSINTEKPLIAGIYLNRLKRNMKLQACPTVIYGLNLYEDKNWNGKLKYSDLKSSSQYNTYLHKGLPPTPICNPGKASILAVLHPEWTEKLFFVVKDKGQHLFAFNFEQHKRNIRIARNN